MITVKQEYKKETDSYILTFSERVAVTPHYILSYDKGATDQASSVTSIQEVKQEWGLDSEPVIMDAPLGTEMEQ